MVEVYHHDVPSDLRSTFKLTTDVHNYRTRSASNQHNYVEYSRAEKMTETKTKTKTKIWKNWCSDMEGLPKSLKL